METNGSIFSAISSGKLSATLKVLHQLDADQFFNVRVRVCVCARARVCVRERERLYTEINGSMLECGARGGTVG
jgi:hypothetical protein